MLSVNTLSLGSFFYMLVPLNFVSLVPYMECKTQNLLQVFYKQIEPKVSKIKFPLYIFFPSVFRLVNGTTIH